MARVLAVILALGLLLLVVLYCSTRQTHPTGAVPVVRGEPPIRIATFNMQRFGPTKAADLRVMSTLVGIVRSYDIVALQEIKDHSGTALPKLLRAVNAVSGSRYDARWSPYTGLAADDHTSQEQYAFCFNTARVRGLDAGALYDDRDDRFQREPFAAHFAVGEWTFALINIHTAPEHAVAEIDALAAVVNWARSHYGNEENIITLGDFNAGCSYARTQALDALALRRGAFVWLVPDSADTNVAQSACAYDRIVLTRQAARAYAGRWGVDHSMGQDVVSDHWPVWAAFAPPAMR